MLIVIGALDRAGAEGQLVEFVRISHPEHARCTVVCLTRPGERADEIHEIGASVSALGLRRGPFGLLGTLFSGVRGVARMAILLRRERPDVVYCLMGAAQLIGFPLAAALTPRSLRVAGLRAEREADPLPFRAELLRDRVLRLAHGAIANSAASVPSWEAGQPALRDRIHVVPNGVALGATHASVRSDVVVTLACVASLFPVKDHRLLLASVAQLPPEPPWRLQLVGDGPLRRTIEAEIAHRRLGHCVELLGRRDDVPAVLANADIAVLTSKSEGTPNALLEAMAAGLPIVATAVGGVPQLVGEQAGLLVAPGDQVELTKALDRLIRDPSLRATLGRAGARRARTEYSLERMRDRTMLAFAQVAGRQTTA